MATMTTEQYTAALLEWAVLYAGVDLPVFPVHSPRKEPRERCDCGKGNGCQHPAKHPRTQHGLSDATCDEAQIRRWWHMWPRANVGIAVPAGYVVLDVDGADGLDALAAQGWKIPRTVTAATGRGWHHWFCAAVDIRPGSDFMPHVDMRGPGGYVIAPPSLHATGRQYGWELSPLDVEFAPAPAWLYELVERARARRARAPSGDLSGPILQNTRNDTLTRIAGAMRRYGCSERAIRAALELTNEERCRPMLEDDELALIASSVARYAPEQLARPADW